jgi:hypothetical protein
MAIKNAVMKGKRLEYKVSELIRKKGLDKDCKRMPRSGALSHLPEDILTKLPIHIECKNREKIQFWQWCDETRSRSTFGREPCLVITSNHRPIMAVVNLEYLLNLLKIEQDYIFEVNKGE